MIDHCFNPACGRELRYLREGRVVRLVGTKPGPPDIKHYWLCGKCYELYDFVFDSDGNLTIGARFHTFIHEIDWPEPDISIAA